MLNLWADYKFLPQAVVTRVPVRGDVWPRRRTPNLLGEDVLFLNEAYCERRQELVQPAAKVTAPSVKVPRFSAADARRLADLFSTLTFTGDMPNAAFLDPAKWSAQATAYSSWTPLVDWTDAAVVTPTAQQSLAEKVSLVVRDMGISWYDSAADEQSGTISQTRTGFSSPLWYARRWSAKTSATGRSVCNPMEDLVAVRPLSDAYGDLSRCYITGRRNFPCWHGGGSDNTKWTGTSPYDYDTPFAAGAFPRIGTSRYDHYKSTDDNGTLTEQATYSSIYLSLGDAETVGGASVPLTAGTITGAAMFVVAWASATASKDVYDQQSGAWQTVSNYNNRLWGRLVPLSKAAKAQGDLGNGVETWKTSDIAGGFSSIEVDAQFPSGGENPVKTQFVNTYAVPLAVVTFEPRSSGWISPEE